MSDSSINLNSHYSTKTQVDLPCGVVISGPETIPTRHVYNDLDARKKLKVINQDIYEKSKKEKSNDAKTFAKWFCGFVLAILAFLGIKKLF